MARNDAGKIYSATYSNVPVYELNVENNHVMRRRSDDWINATHILKVADYDKPARTRILEREVQKGVHEKVQGGYGKYQGKSESGYHCCDKVADKVQAPGSHSKKVEILLLRMESLRSSGPSSNMYRETAVHRQRRSTPRPFPASQESQERQRRRADS